MKDLEEKLQNMENEIEELSIQLADMLGATLHFAGVKKDKIPSAVEAYLEGIDEVYGDDDGEMGLGEIIEVINHLKKTKKDLFK